jgi:hypothetical protein
MNTINRKGLHVGVVTASADRTLTEMPRRGDGREAARDCPQAPRGAGMSRHS